MTPVVPNERKGVVTNHLVRATQEPGVVREVDDAELVDLARQGLLHSYERTDAAKEALADVRVLGTQKPWKAPARGEEIVEPSPDVTEPPASADEKGA